jgi:hypothetical protein
MTPSPADLNELLRTHARLREIMLLASARIKRQALGHQDYELLKNMREALIESRTIARQFEKRKLVANPKNEPGVERF